MPRTIRKRQLRNKKSRKQRGGGGVNEEQIAQIKSIQTTINENINKLVELLGNNVLDESVNLPIKTKPIAESEHANPNLVAIDNVVVDNYATTNKNTDNTNDNN